VAAGEDAAVGRVLRTGAPARVDDWGGGDFHTGYRSTAAAPIVVAGALWGAVAIASQEPLPAETENRLAGFAELVSLAVASAQARADLAASRARLVKAGDEQRRRLERNLHDGAQQRLVSLALLLRLASRYAGDDPERARRELAVASEELEHALAELRELARGLHPAVLTDHGLEVALRSICDRAPLPVDLEIELAAQPSEAVQAAAYFVVTEALTNVAKYARATGVRVRLRTDAGALAVEVGDDGVGGADPARGSGLNGLADRVEALGGRLELDSPPAGGTRIRVRLPL
jgi:signal transduction histidine kinase